jgi:hypothetical protein
VNRAATAAVVRVLFLPWLVFLALTTIGVFYTTFAVRYSRPREVDIMMLMILLWAALGLVNDAIFGFWAARNLQTQFRLAATRRFETAARWRKATKPLS